jgi:hypothetical protein
LGLARETKAGAKTKYSSSFPTSTFFNNHNIIHIIQKQCPKDPAPAPQMVPRRIQQSVSLVHCPSACATSASRRLLTCCSCGQAEEIAPGRLGTFFDDQDAAPGRSHYRVEWCALFHRTRFSTRIYADIPSRLLRSHVCFLIDAILSWSCIGIRQSLGRAGIHAFWSFFRFHGREGGEMEEEEQSYGAGA